MTDGVEPDRWGTDHWGAFTYVESCVVDRRGVPDTRRVQTNANRHPALFTAGMVNGRSRPDGAASSIRLRDGDLPGPDYDEWDCIADFERCGFVVNDGTGIHPRYRMTPPGEALAAQIRVHKGRGGKFSDFEPDWDAIPSVAQPHEADTHEGVSA